MTVLWVQLMVDELLVVLLQFTYVGELEQVIAVVHLLTYRVQRLYHLAYVSDDRLVGITLRRYLSEEVVKQRLVDGELHHLWVNKHELQFTRVLLV